MVVNKMLGELIVKISADFDDFEKKFTESQKKIVEMGEKLNSIGSKLTTFVTLPLVALGGTSIKLASDLQETLNKINVAFEESADEVLNWSKTSIEAMGLSQASALEASALFGDFATAMGFTRKEASKMAMDLTQLGADLASFKNIPVEQAMNALKGVFTGETESLKLLGVVMTETNLKAFALSQGIKKEVKEMTESEKINLRLAYVMKATTNAQGDFARTSNGSANQTRMFNENLKELGTQFGDILLPIFTKVITKINEMIKSFQGLSPETKQTIVIIAGIVAVIGPLLLVIGTLLTLVPLVINGFMGIVTAVKAVGSAMVFLATNPIGWIILAIGALIAIIILVYKNWDEVSKFFLATWEIIKKGLNYAFENVPILKLFKNIYDNWDRVTSFFISTWDIIKNVFSSSISFISSSFERFINGIIDKINSVINMINKIPFVDIDNISKVDFNKKIEVAKPTMPSFLMNQQQSYTSNPIKTNIMPQMYPPSIFLDGKQINNVISPFMIDTIRTKIGYS